MKVTPIQPNPASLARSLLHISHRRQPVIETRAQKTKNASDAKLGTIVSEVESILDQIVIGNSYETSILYPRQKNSDYQTVIYNPSNHDKFICDGRPKKLHKLDSDNLDACWVRPIETLLMAHSFSSPPTHSNVVLERETSISDNHLVTPAAESWSKDGYNENIELVPIRFQSMQSSCPLMENGITCSKVGNDDLTRSIWSNDGATDIYVEGSPSDTYILKLAFPLEHHKPLHTAKFNLVWIQDDRSRVSLAIQCNRECTREMSSVVTVASGLFEVHVSPDMLPLRVRMIVENLDSFNNDVDAHPSYYAQRMFDDMFEIPHLFSVARGVDLSSLSSLRNESQQ
ncbi:hypothetical protein ACHAWO_010090 [Cyclotella atomus]|uniref:Anaphase-promoting complex subunit 1 n=1 Tax=Cyclotella atomus TaxID=382360 RepID=A0ABD3QR78_9STRA